MWWPLYLLSGKRGVILRLPGDKYPSSQHKSGHSEGPRNDDFTFYGGSRTASILSYCIPGNFSDVETLANLAINSFSLKLQVANLVLHCNTSTSIKVYTMENAKIAKIKRR